MAAAIEEVRAAVNKYKKDRIAPVLPPDTVRYDVWRCGFQEHLEVWEAIAIQEAKSQIADAVNRFNSCPSDAMLRMVGVSANSVVRNYSFCPSRSKKWVSMFERLHRQIRDLWLSAFEQHPKFPEFIEG